MTTNDNWFSNFGESDTPFVYDGISYTTPEHFYQAMKWGRDHPNFQEERRKIAALPTALEAKKASKMIPIRADWNNIRVRIMCMALEHKFAQGTTWHAKLMATGNKHLCEYNYWHDNFWGCCTCDRCKMISPKVNMLGELLMWIRG